MVTPKFAELLGLGTPELILILAIILLLFGGSRLPQLSRSIGTSIKELRKGLSEGVKDEKTAAKTKDTTPKA